MRPYAWRISTLLTIVVMLTEGPSQVDGRLLYISKAFGNDTGGCDNATLPCNSLAYVISQVRSSGDTVVMDATGTDVYPYDECPKQAIVIGGDLSFMSSNGTAVVNCSGGAMLFRRPPSSLAIAVNITGLSLADTHLSFVNVSFAAHSCVFAAHMAHRAFSYIVNVTFSLRLRPPQPYSITVRNSRVANGNTAGFLAITNPQSALYVEMTGTNISGTSVVNASSLVAVTGVGHFVFRGVQLASNLFPSNSFLSYAFLFQQKESRALKSSLFSTTNSLNLTMDGVVFRNNTCGFLDLANTSAWSHVSIVGASFIGNNGYISENPLRLWSVAASSVEVANCRFEDNRAYGGALIFPASSSADVVIKSSKFVHNQFYFSMILASNVKSLTLDDCRFNSNTFGAAIDVSSSVQGIVNITWCQFHDHLAILGQAMLSINNTLCSVTDSLFVNNASPQSPGAIHFRGDAKLVIDRCTFLDNFGCSTASALALGNIRLENGKGSALIANSVFIQRHFTKNVRRAPWNGSVKGGLAMTSKGFGAILLSNTTFDFAYDPPMASFIVIDASQGSLVMDNASIVRCPVNCRISKLVESYASSAVNMISYKCRTCSMRSYSQDRGYYHGPETRHTVKCNACPHGAVCDNRLEALPNFWGVQTDRSPGEEPMVEFHHCPLGYCCQPPYGQQSCYPYNTCTTNRNGRLCGQCAPNYTETLFTPSCRPIERCNDFWFWPVAVIFLFLFAVYLIAQPDVARLLWTGITWFRQDATDGAVDERETDPGFERIVFFYYQAANVLIVESPVTVWNNNLLNFLLGLFNFEIRVRQDGFACPVRGLGPVTKVLFRTLGVYSVVIGIPLLYVCHYALCVCLNRRRPKSSIYLAAFVKAVVLGYAVLTLKILVLLKCVTVNGVSCLFINCHIVCYTWWQTIIVTLVVIYILPFAVALYFAAHRLFTKRISAGMFVLACMFPLPVLCYWFLTRRNASHDRFVDGTRGGDAILAALVRPYRLPDPLHRGAIYWESVLIARILLLVLAFVLVHEPFTRSLLQLFLTVLILLVHTYVLPFELAAANKAEMISLFTLVVISLTSIPHSGYLTEGVTPTGPISGLIDVCSWIQIVVVAFLPFLFCLAIAAALVSQSVRCACTLFRVIREACWAPRHTEMSEPLATEEIYDH